MPSVGILLFALGFLFRFRFFKLGRLGRLGRGNGCIIGKRIATIIQRFQIDRGGLDQFMGLWGLVLVPQRLKQLTVLCP